MSTPVRMTVRWFVPPPESGTILAALHALMVAARAEPGSCGCQLTTDLGERAGLSYTEEWIHEDELKRQPRLPQKGRIEKSKLRCHNFNIKSL